VHIDSGWPPSTSVCEIVSVEGFSPPRRLISGPSDAVLAAKTQLAIVKLLPIATRAPPPADAVFSTTVQLTIVAVLVSQSMPPPLEFAALPLTRQFTIVALLVSTSNPSPLSLAMFPLTTQFVIVGLLECRQHTPPPSATPPPLLIVKPSMIAIAVSRWSNRNPRPTPSQSMTQLPGPFADRTAMSLPL
jgi:hypothetical protein